MSNYAIKDAVQNIIDFESASTSIHSNATVSCRTTYNNRIETYGTMLTRPCTTVISFAASVAYGTRSERWTEQLSAKTGATHGYSY